MHRSIRTLSHLSLRNLRNRRNHMIKKICNEAGCNKLIPYNERYCSQHKKAPKEWSIATSDYNHLYHTPEWNRDSKRYLKEHPYCSNCGREATVVDHIIAHRGSLTLFNDISNWQSLCKECHDEKTRREIIQRKKEASFEYQRAKRNNTLHIHNVNR